MRPTITEQLTIIRRILDQVIAPEVSGDYPRRLLTEILGHLDDLAKNWSALQSQLVAENATLRLCLAAARGHTTGALADEIDDALSAPAPDPLDHSAVCELNTALRAVTAKIIVAARTDAALGLPATEIRGLLRESLQVR